MKKTAQQRSLLNKLKTKYNPHKFLSSYLDKDFNKLIENTEKCDDLARAAMMGKDKDSSFVRKVRMAQSFFNRDNYLACGINIVDSTEMLKDTKAYLDKANLSLAGFFPEVTKSKFEESGGTREDLDNVLKKLRMTSANFQAEIIKEAGISDWFFNIKQKLGDLSYGATNFNLWKKIFTSSTPLINATKKMVAELQGIAKISIDHFDKMANNLSATDLGAYYKLSAALSIQISEYLEKYKTYNDLFFEPILNKLNEENVTVNNPLPMLLEDKTNIGPEFFNNLLMIKDSEFRKLNYEDLAFINGTVNLHLASDKVEHSDGLKNILKNIKSIKTEKDDVFNDTLNQIINNTVSSKITSSLPIDFFIFLGFQPESMIKKIPSDKLQTLITHLDGIKNKSSKNVLAKLESIRKILLSTFINTKTSTASISFSHIRNIEIADKLNAYIESGKIAQAMKIIDNEMLLVQDDKKKQFILNSFKERIKDFK